MAAKGFPVFPLKINTKDKPLLKAWQQVASADPSKIKAWWGRWPDANIGVLTTGWLVLDVDVKDGKEGNTSMFELGIDLSTFTVLTPSGGRHLYYGDADVSCAVDILGPGSGLDIRSDRGYVVGPGSEIDGRLYEVETDRPIAPASEALVELIHKAKDDTSRTGAPAVQLDTPEAIDRVTSFLREEAPLAVEGKGGDNTTFKVAAACKDMGVSEDIAVQLMAQGWNARCTPPWAPGELATKVRNAFAYGFSPPGCATPEAFFRGVTVSIPNDETNRPTAELASSLGRPFRYQHPATFPARNWLYRPGFTRRFCSLTVAPGGVGKTSLAIVEALAIATGKPLLGVTPTERTPVWLWNGEDPLEETQRRVLAAMLQYGLTAEDVEGRLFIGSGREGELALVTQERDGARVARPVEDAVTSYIRQGGIGLVVIDPFVSSHRVSENDNGAIDVVVKTWGRIAEATGCAVHLVHHTRKTGGYDGTVEDSRGASALLAGVRYGRVLNVMSEEEARRLRVDPLKRRSYVRIDDGKTSMTPPAAAAEWIRLVSVPLGNSDKHGNTDHVQVAVRWEVPDPNEGITPDVIRGVQDLIRAGRAGDAPWRQSVQAKDGAWVGYAVGKVLGLDPTDATDEARIKSLVKSWTDQGWFRVVSRAIDEKGKRAPCIEVGRWAGGDPPPLEGGG